MNYETNTVPLSCMFSFSILQLIVLVHVFIYLFIYFFVHDSTVSVQTYSSHQPNF